MKCLLGHLINVSRLERNRFLSMALVLFVAFPNCRYLDYDLQVIKDTILLFDYFNKNEIISLEDYFADNLTEF